MLFVIPQNPHGLLSFSLSPLGVLALPLIKLLLYS